MTKDRTWRFQKLIITQCFFVPLLQNLNPRYTLICLNNASNFKAIHHCTRYLLQFQKVLQKEEKGEENRAALIFASKFF